MVVTKKPTPYSHLMVFIGNASVLGRRSTLKMKSILKSWTHIFKDWQCPSIFQLPQAIALGIIGNCSLTKTIDALDACLKIKKSYRGHKKRILTDHGKQIKFCCGCWHVEEDAGCQGYSGTWFPPACDTLSGWVCFTVCLLCVNIPHFHIKK